MVCNLAEILRIRTRVGGEGRETDGAEEPVPALDDLAARAEQQESSSTISALCFPLSETLIANQSTLLVTDKPADRHASQRAISNIPVDLRGRHKPWQNRFPEAKEIE